MNVADTIKDITRKHLEGGGLLLGQCLRAVGWVGGTVPDCEGLVELPTTDVAGAGIAVGAALAGRRPIFIVRYQGFMWLNASPLVNYAAKSMAIWKQPCPLFIRAIGMEGHGVGHTASGMLHTLFMHTPGFKVAAPMTPVEYKRTWNWFMSGDEPLYCSEHRRSFTSSGEFVTYFGNDSDITLVGISAARYSVEEAAQKLAIQYGVVCDVFHLVFLKPLELSSDLIESVRRTRRAIIVDTDFVICGCAEHVAHELIKRATLLQVKVLGLDDRPSGTSRAIENVTPSAQRIIDEVKAWR